MFHFKTIDERTKKRPIKSPQRFAYRIGRLIAWVANLCCNTHFHFIAKPGDDPNPIVMIANHSTRGDYQYTIPACLPKRLNFVVAKNEFFRFPNCFLFPPASVIPKKNFTPDVFAMRKILRAAKDGLDLCFMPEGLSSMDGMARPVMLGTGELIKKLDRPVYYSKICGGYMTFTKYNLDLRKGRIDVYVDRMFTPEQLREMTPEQIEDEMNRLLAHDDFIWNKTARVRYNGKGRMTVGLETLLYLCPRCGAVHKMKTDGSRMSCTQCGNTVELNEYYDLIPAEGSECPELITDWTMLQREKAKEEVRRDGFRYDGHCSIGILPEYLPIFGNKSAVYCGEGSLCLNAEGLHFSGTLKEKPYTFDIPTKLLPSIIVPNDMSFFFLYVDGSYVEFRPDNNDVYHWQLLTEEIHRLGGGKWKPVPYRDTPVDPAAAQ